MWQRLPFVLLALFEQCVAEDLSLHPRNTLTTLASFCNAPQLGTVIADDVLYAAFMPSWKLSGDSNRTDFYSMKLPLNESFATTDLSRYQLELSSLGAPGISDTSLFVDRSNSTITSYGGQLIGALSSENFTFYSYDIEGHFWRGGLGVPPKVPIPRIKNGASVNVPDAQAAYYIGGYSDNTTNPNLTDLEWSQSMLVVNTSDRSTAFTSAPAPKIKGGDAVTIPAGEQGLLFYIGGQQSTSKTGSDTIPAPWDFVQVFDIASSQWYNQSTTGTVSARTGFCASAVYDTTSGTYQIYIIGGAVNGVAETSVSYLSIPSFKWYTTNGLPQGRINLNCELKGSQILGIGGRANNAADVTACYGQPLFVYDLLAHTVASSFEPDSTAYTAPTSVVQDIATASYPSSWANKNLEAIFTASVKPAASDGAPTPLNSSSTSGSGSDAGAIAGGVVGGVVGLALILGLVWFVLRRRRRSTAKADREEIERPYSKNELSAETRLFPTWPRDSKERPLSAGDHAVEVEAAHRHEMEAAHRHEMEAVNRHEMPASPVEREMPP